MMIDANAAITLLEKRAEKKRQDLNGIRTHDLCVTGAISYQSHMRAVVCGLAVRSYCKQRLLFRPLFSVL